MPNQSFPKPAPRRNTVQKSNYVTETRAQQDYKAKKTHDNAPRYRHTDSLRPKDDDATTEDRTPLLCGVKPVLELLESTPERIDAIFIRKGQRSSAVATIMDLCRSSGIRFSLLDTEYFARLHAGNSQGVAARLYEAGFIELEDLFQSVMDAPLPLIVALDQVQDPGNVGTFARTFYAMGGAGMVIPRHNGVYLGSAASRAGAGALEKLAIAKVANIGQALEAAKKNGFTVYGSGSGSVSEKEMPESASSRDKPKGQKQIETPNLDIFSMVPRLPAILVLGGEEDGMRPGVRKHCDILLHIPMLRDFDSLNVAQAGAIIVSRFAEAVLKK